MAKRPLHAFDAETAFTLLYTALLPLGYRLYRGDLGSEVQVSYIHDKMKLVVFYETPLPFLQIHSMHDNPILKVWFDDFQIKTILLNPREKTGYWQMPTDKSLIDALLLSIQISATINQYVQDHYDLPIFESANDIVRYSRTKKA